MTAGEIRKMLKGIPKDMQVLLSIGESLEHICPVSSQPFMLEYEETGETEMVFVLSECTCEESEVDELTELTGTKEEIIERLTGTIITPN